MGARSLAEAIALFIGCEAVPNGKDYDDPEFDNIPTSGMLASEIPVGLLVEFIKSENITWLTSDGGINQ